MSWVAARKFRQKKITVRKRTLGPSSLFSSSKTSMCWKTKKIIRLYVLQENGVWFFTHCFHWLWELSCKLPRSFGTGKAQGSKKLLSPIPRFSIPTLPPFLPCFTPPPSKTKAIFFNLVPPPPVSPPRSPSKFDNAAQQFNQSGYEPLSLENGLSEQW